MTTWRPASSKEVEQLLADGISALSALHRAQFERIRINPERISVADSPGEFVIAVARHEGRLLYYSDIEDGWELGEPNSNGGIDTRGTNQFDLAHLVFQIFGDSGASGPNPLLQIRLTCGQRLKSNP